MPARMSGDSTVPPLSGDGPRDHRAVRIAEHDARAHPDQLVHEEEPRLEHLLEDEQHARALGGGDDGGGHDVGRKRRPGPVLQLRHVAAEVGTDPPLLIGAHDAAGCPRSAGRMPSRSKPSRVLRRSSPPHRIDGDLAIGDGGETDEAADLDVVGPDGVARSRRAAARPRWYRCWSRCPRSRRPSPPGSAPGPGRAARTPRCAARCDPWPSPRPSARSRCR